MQFDWEYRPKSYFFADDWRGEVLSHIDGQLRRKQAEKELAAIGTYEEYVAASIDGRLDPALFRRQTADERQALGAIHPALMGGEYLPAIRNSETEIARLSLQSTLADCTSIRARFAGGRYRYRIVDEYDQVFEFSPKSSRRPLTFRQLVDLIDSVSCEDLDLPSGLHTMYLWMNLEESNSPEDLENFATMESYIYPQLGAYYRERSREMVAARVREIEEAEDD